MFFWKCHRTSIPPTRGWSTVVVTGQQPPWGDWSTMTITIQSYRVGGIGVLWQLQHFNPVWVGLGYKDDFSSSAIKWHIVDIVITYLYSIVMIWKSWCYSLKRFRDIGLIFPFKLTLCLFLLYFTSQVCICIEMCQ
jgi:uncharacterized membrane protein YhaH (DUF805 family)